MASNAIKNVIAYEAFMGTAGTTEELYEYYKTDDVAVSIVNIIEDSDYGTAFFADTTITTLEQKMEILYKQILGRDSDEDGMNYWLGEIEAGRQSLTSVAAQFIDGAFASGEFDDSTIAAYSAAATALEAYEAPADEVEGETYYLTTGVDVLTGTDDADTFVADLNQLVYTGSVANTLATGDRIDGGSSTDTLTAKLTIQQVTSTDSVVDVQPTTTSVEIVTIEAQDESDGTGYAVLDAKNMTGVTSIGSSYSDGDLVIENLTTLNNDGEELNARNTNAMTITMDHTDNFNSDNDASDLTVYFDEDYFITDSTNTDSQLTINMINTLNNKLADGSSLIEGFETLSFFVGDTEITVSVEGLQLSEVKAAIETALVNAGITTVSVSTYTEEAYFATNIYYEDTATTYAAGSSAGDDYTAFILTNSGPEELTEGSFTLTDAARDGSLAYSQDDRESVIVNNPLSVDIVLDKVGREGEGGNIIVGGKELDQDAGATDKGHGIPQFDVYVNGTDSQDSNLGAILSTNGALTTVNISDGTEFDGADLVVRGTGSDEENSNVAINTAPFGGTLETLDASGFSGDLTIGEDTAAQNIDTFTATGGGNVTLWENITNGGGGFTSSDDNAYSVTTANGSDNITINAEDGAQVTVNTGANNDTISIEFNGEDTSGSDLTTATITSTSGDNIVNVDEGGSEDSGAGGDDYLYEANIELGSGDDEVNGGDINITVDTGAGDDAIYASNEATKAVFVEAANAATVELGSSNNVDGDKTGNSIDDVELLYGRTVSVTLATQGLSVGDTAYATAFDSGFESIEVAISASNGYLTTELDLYTAIMTAINTDPVLSELAKASINSLGDLTVEYLVDGVVVDGNAALEYIISDVEFDAAGVNNELSTTEQNGILAALQEKYQDSGITLATVENAYDGISLTGYLTDAIQDGDYSLDNDQNTINGGQGDDVIVLNSNMASVVVDTIVFDIDNIGNDTIVNFEEDNGSDEGDILDFSAWLTNEYSISGSSVSQTAIATDWEDGADTGIAVLDDFTANSIVTATFGDVASAYGNTTTTISFGTLTDTQLLNALNDNSAVNANANGAIFSVDVYAGLGTLVGSTQKSILMIESNVNDGEYIVAQVSANNVAGDDQFTSATIIGTVDFGDTVEFDDSNFA